MTIKYQEKSREGIEAASATYRKATNMVAEKLGIDVEHTNYPKEDFKKILQKLDNVQDLDNINSIALSYYYAGLKRGLTKATDWVADKTFKYQNDGSLLSPNDLVVKVRITMPNQEISKEKFEFTANDIGFG